MKADKSTHLPSGVGGDELFGGSMVRKPHGISRAEKIALSANVKGITFSVKAMLQRRNEVLGCSKLLTIHGNFNICFNASLIDLTFRMLSASLQFGVA